MTKTLIKKIVQAIQAKFELLSFVQGDVTKALDVAVSDIEDNIQYVISLKKKCFWFITNNIKDYRYYANINTLNSKQIRTIKR